MSINTNLNTAGALQGQAANFLPTLWAEGCIKGHEMENFFGQFEGKSSRSPIMAKTEAANRNAIALLMQRIVLVAVTRVRRRDVFDIERRALNATGLAEKVKLVVGDSFEKCGSAGLDGACSKVIGDSAENFVHEIKPRCNR